MKATAAAVLKAAQERLWDAERKSAFFEDLDRAYDAAAHEARNAAYRARDARIAAIGEVEKAREALHLLARAELAPESEGVNQSTLSGGAL